MNTHAPSSAFFVLSMNDWCQKLLNYGWTTTYNSLLEDPESTTWYIDDRANPKDFWALMAFGHPTIYIRRQKKFTISVLHHALKLLFKPENQQILYMQAHSSALRSKN